MNLADSNNIDDGFRQIDPFGFWPRRASSLIDRAGATEPSAGYAFHTPYVLGSSEGFEFRITIDGLSADEGELRLLVNELAPDGQVEAVCVATNRASLRAIKANDGLVTIAGASKHGHRYAVVGLMADELPRPAAQLAIAVGDFAAREDHRRLLRDARRTIFDREPLFQGLYTFVKTEPTMARPVSQGCTVAQFGEPDYQRWTDALNRPLHWHRKHWEFVYILRSLESYGVLRPGSRGLGFGVGEEPLPALMAAIGCKVTATDLPAEDARTAAWSGTNQHAASLDGMRRPDLVADAELERLVTFRPVDMTRIPDDLTDYDFTWSSCALEHVGSIAAGLDFIERSIQCLRPGGIAVHTTELNLVSNDDTLDHTDTVLFRRRDFEEIATRLILQGHKVMPLNFTGGDRPLDDHIDVPPYSGNNHFKLLISRYVTTSFGLIVQRGFP